MSMANGARCGVALAAFVVCTAAATMRAQTAAAPKPAADSSTTASGFSIETEMLTYRALESNSEAIACDIAAWLNGATADFKTPPSGMACNAGSGSGTQGRIVLLPFDRAQLANFQIWRADMATMQRLQQTVADLRSAVGGCTGQQGAAAPGADATRAATTSTATSAAGSLLSMTPAGPPLALAQSVFGLLASDHAASSVTGTIKDQAFMDGVARELRSLKVQVVMPSSYAPGALATLDEGSSPFLHNRAKTLKDRECLVQMEASSKVENKAAVEQALGEIDAFMGSLGDDTAAKSARPAKAADSAAAASGVAPAAGAAASAPAPVPAPANAAVAAGRGAQAPAATATASPAPVVQPVASTATGPSASASTHVGAVLEADGLAQLLGVDPDSGQLPGRPLNHILLVQALESGGTVERSSNVLGTSYRYSGGSVGTYALFSTGGDLECSGNVYDYAGSLKAKKFASGLQGYKANPQGQMIFLHSCSGVKTGIR